MEIISYGKSVKAQKRIKEINERLGHTDKFKHGEQDLKGKVNSANLRIKTLEAALNPVVVNTEISKETSRVTINLNKHMLKFKNITGIKTMGYQNMIYDDLSNKNIWASYSTGQIYNADKKTFSKSISYSTATLVNNAVTTKEIPKNVYVSIAYGQDPNKKIAVDLTKATLTNIVLSGATYILSNVNGIYAEEGFIETGSIELGVGVEKIKSIELNGLLNQTGMQTYIATSSDGVNFMEYELINNEILNESKITGEFIKLMV